jgi:hypothetical protein
MRKLSKPRNVRNVDGTMNELEAGQIEHAVDLEINHNGVKTWHAFYVADIGPDDFLLGYPLL